MPELKESRPYYENRAKRELISSFLGKRTWDSYWAWCKKMDLDPYGKWTFKKFLSQPRELCRSFSIKNLTAALKLKTKK